MTPQDLTDTELRVRKTHRYVDTYRHIDQWEPVGTYRELSREALECPAPDPDEFDMTEPRLERALVLVAPADETDEKTTVQALRDLYTEAGCAHEHDCCGCRSYHVRHVARVTGQLWCVEISSSRNF